MNFWETLTLIPDVKQRQIEEFVRKYESTFVWLKGKDVNRLVYFSQYEDNFFYFDDKDIRIAYDSEYTLQASFPTTKIIAHKDWGFAVFTRKPARQYKKAPCLTNCSIIAPLRGYVTGNIAVDFNRHVLYEAFCPTYYDFNHAVSLIAEGAVGVPLSDKFAVSIHTATDDELVLWYLTTPIATYKGNTLTLLNKDLRQEVLDYISLHSLEINCEQL